MSRVTHPLRQVNEAIADVEAGRVAARIVLQPNAIASGATRANEERSPAFHTIGFSVYASTLPVHSSLTIEPPPPTMNTSHV